MTEGAEAGGGGIARFRLETETMPDGRRIHYYSWPADPARSGEPVDGGAPEPRPSDPTEEQLG